MSSKAPPVPPAAQSPKGTGDPKSVNLKEAAPGGNASTDPDKRGQQGNTKQNTTHQGYQQDR